MNSLKLMNVLQKVAEQQGVDFLSRYSVKLEWHEKESSVEFKIDESYRILTVYQNPIGV